MLSERLKKARKNKKYTQETLAKKLNTTKGTISNYENGYSTPSNEMLVMLADILDVSTDYLLGRSCTQDFVVIAAHRSDNELEDLPEEAFREIENFKEFIRLKYGSVNKKGE